MGNGQPLVGEDNEPADFIQELHQTESKGGPIYFPKLKEGVPQPFRARPGDIYMAYKIKPEPGRRIVLLFIVDLNGVRRDISCDNEGDVDEEEVGEGEERDLSENLSAELEALAETPMLARLAFVLIDAIEAADDQEDRKALCEQLRDVTSEIRGDLKALQGYRSS